MLELITSSVCGVQVSSGDVYLVSGHGFSCVPKGAQAAWQYLYALEAAEEEQQQQQQQQVADGDDVDADAAMDADEDVHTTESSCSRTIQQGEGEEGVEEIAVGEPWTPSAELLARQPDILRIPFQLEGCWWNATGKLVLKKKHTFGCNNEIIYQGTCTVSADARVLTMQMRCAFAEALLPLALMATGSFVAVVSIPQLHDFHLA